MSVQIHTYVQNAFPEDLLSRWKAVPTSVVVDLQRQEDLVDPRIRPIRPPGTQPRLFGFAVTANCEAPDFGAVLHSMDILEDRSVLVIAAGGLPTRAMIGDVLAGYARAQGASGIICDGAVRDVATFGRWNDFAVYARSICPRGPSSAKAGAVNAPVQFGGRTVAPGDLIIGDDDGLAILSPPEVYELIAGAERKLEKEVNWLRGFSDGRTVRDVFDLT